MVKVRVGQRVVRGPVWSGGNEDGGEAGLGTVIDANDGSSTTDSPSGVRVRWDSGEEGFYAEERALRVVDPSGTGGIPTSSSDEQDISEGAHRQVLSPEAKETEKRFGKKGEPQATQQVSHTSRPNRLRVPPGRSRPRPIARPACKFSVPYKSSRQDDIDVRDAVRSDKAEETVTTDNHSHTSASRMVYDLKDDGSSSQLPNISGVASVARSESEDRAFKSSPIAILSPGKKMPGHSDPKAMVTERTTAHTVNSLEKVEYVDVTNISHIEAPDTPVTPASTASTPGTATSSATHSSDDHEQYSGNVYNILPTSRTTRDYALSSNEHQAVRAVPTSGGMISDYGNGEEFKPEQLRSLVNSFACQSDNSPAIRLVKAIRSGSIESARSTFLELRDSLNIRVTHQQLSCAHIAVLHGSLPMLQVLISCGADMTVADWIGNTPLHFAARIGSSPIIHALITNSPAEIDVLNLKLVTALHIAALVGQHEAVQQLLLLDANVNLKDCEGNTPLHNAAWSNHVNILEMLLDAGADMSITNEKTFNVVHHACYQGNSWPVLRLLRRRPEMVNSIMEKGMYSPLHIAANNNHYSTAEVLLKEPLCHKDAVDHSLQTPLMLAVRRGVKACTELLVAFGADLEMQDEQGSTVLHLAVNNLQEDTRVMSSFIEIDVDESGERSPHINQIQMSIASGNPIEDRVAGIACFLVQEGCSVMKQNWHNQTPLDICFEPRVAAHLRRFDQRRGKPKVRGSKKPRAKGNDAPTRTAAVPSGNFRDSPSRHSDVQPGEVSADEALAATTASSVAAKERFPDCRICGKAGGASIMFLSCRDNVVCPGCSQLLETCNVCNKHIEEKYLLDKPLTTSHRRTPVFKEKCIVCDDAPATVSFDPCYDTITCPRCCYRLKTCNNCGVLIKGRYENMAAAPLSSTASASTAGSELSVNFEVFVKDVDSPYSRGLTEFSRRASEEGLQVRVKRNSLQDNDSMEVVSLTVEFSKTETNVTVFLKLLVMLLPTDVETDYVTETSFNERSLRTVMSLVTRLLEDFKSSENVVPAALLCITFVVHENTVQYIHSEGGFYLDIVFTMMHAVHQALRDGTGNVAQAVDQLLPFIGNNSTIDTDKYNMKPLDEYLQEYKRLLQDAGVIHISSSDEQDISEGAHRQVLSPEAKEAEKKFGKKDELVPKEQPVLRQPEPTFDPSIAGPGTLFDCRVGHTCGLPTSSSDEQDISEGAHRQVLSPEARETEKKFGKKGPQPGWRRAQPKKVDVENAVSHTLEQKDMTNVRRFRISICGQFSTGKTSLFDSLRNKDFVPKKKSTLVATVQDSIFVEGGLTDTTMSAADYILLDVKERILEEERIRTEKEKLGKEQVDLEGDAALLPVRITNGRPEPLMHERRPCPSSQRRAERSKPKQVRLDINLTQWRDEILQNILNDKEIMRTIGSSEVVVSTWDSGGQSVFSSIQHLLMGDDNVIYVLCFDSSEELDKVKKQMYISLGADGTERKVRTIEVPECLRNIDHIRHWLTAIHFAKKDDSQIPPVIFVGTFADVATKKFSCTTEDLKKGLWQNLQGYCKRSPTFQAMEDDTFSTHGPDSLHLVDNTVSGKADTRSVEVQALCKHLQKAMDAVLEGNEIKKEWLRFEWVLQRLRQERQKSMSLPGYIEHEYAAELAAKVCNITDANEVEDMLQYYDQLRLIIYRPNSASKPAHASFSSKESNTRIVVYDVAWLIEKFNDLIYGPEFTGKMENPQGTDKPKDKAPSHRHTLWKTGVLSSTLINTSWKHLREVTDQLLEIMVSFELFYPNGNGSYLVPFALQVRPDPSILESMREESHVIRGARMAITTCDIPLLIKAHPDDGMCYEEDPDTPLPHSDYFFLLVRLMQKWKITRPDQSVRLQYNSAWMAIPNASLGLRNFHGCSVSVFLAHYEISGAILLSACIEQDTKSFKPSHISSRDGKSEKIANVLCNIRQAVINIVRDLHGSKRPRPKLSLLPFPPACGCREENTDKDLGNAHWKIPIQGDDFALPHEIEASVHCNNDESSTQKQVMERNPSIATCQSCGDVYNEPCNGNAWFNRESNFVLVHSNEEAQQQYQDFRNQQIKKQRPLTGHLKSSDSPSAPKPTHPAATKASSPAASPKGKRKRTSSTSPPPPQGPQPGGTPAQHKKVDIEKAVGHTLEQKDMTNVRRFRISICGQFSTGKTSLFDSLRNKNFVLEKKSTLVATVQDSIFVEGGLTDTTMSAADFILLDVKERILEEERIRTEKEKLRKKQVDLEMEQRRAAKDLQRTQDLVQQQHTPVMIPSDKPSNPGERDAAPLPAHTTSGQPGRTQPDPSLSTTITPPVYERPPCQSSQRRTERSKPNQPDINLRQWHEEILQKILNDKEIMRTIENSEVVVSTWDSGGQSVFSSIQHLLMGDENVIYVLCFNSSEQLDEVKKQMYIGLGPNGTERKVRTIEVPECLRNIDHIRHWLTAIHFAKKDDSRIPPVIFVGTFADIAIEKSSCTMEEFKEGLWRNLQGYCKRSPTFQAMEDDELSTQGPKSLYLVDNTVSGTTDARSDEVQALSNHLQKAMDAVLGGNKIKKDWLRFEWVLQRLRQERQKSKSLPGYIEHEYAAELAAKVCNITDANEVEDMLQYYDQLRLIIYRPNSASKPAHASFLSKESNARIVVYDVAWLIEKFNDLIYGPEFTGKMENPEGTDKPKDKAPSHRHTLWKTGVLSSQLINTSWKHLREVTDQLLEIMVSFELFYPYGNESYLVPFALQVRPDPSILESMRKESHVIRGARMAITTCDIPLLIKAHPDNDMCYEEDPDTPLPHSDYFFLLVRLMQKWKITRPDQSVRLQYNSAWMVIPNASLGLNNYYGCSVSVFLAHYEISGAILLSACIEQDIKSFKQSHVSSHNGKSEKIASVLCNIRQAVIDIVRDLHGSKRPRPKLFLLPFPPACRCLEENTDSDLGNAHWKIPIQGDNFAPPHDVEASVHCNNDESSTQKSVMERLPSNCICQSCGDVYKEPCNGNAWFNRESNFELVHSNKEAQQQYQDFRNQQIKKQRPLTDLWKSPEFLEKYRRFVDCLPPAEFRVECMACSLISASDNSLLMTKERDGQLRHNEYLIGHLKIGGTDSFRLFCKVLRKMGSMFEPDAKAMEDVAQRHTNPEL